MSYNTAYIDVWDKEGYLHQIYQVQGQLSFANAERCKDSARKIVREASFIVTRNPRLESAQVDRIGRFQCRM